MAGNVETGIDGFSGVFVYKLPAIRRLAPYVGADPPDEFLFVDDDRFFKPSTAKVAFFTAQSIIVFFCHVFRNVLCSVFSARNFFDMNVSVSPNVVEDVVIAINKWQVEKNDMIMDFSASRLELDDGKILDDCALRRKNEVIQPFDEERKTVVRGFDVKGQLPKRQNQEFGDIRFALLVDPGVKIRVHQSTNCLPRTPHGTSAVFRPFLLRSLDGLPS